MFGFGKSERYKRGGVTPMATNLPRTAAVGEDDPLPPEGHRPAPGGDATASLYRVRGTSLTGFQKVQLLRKLAVYQRNPAWSRYWLANDIDRTSVDAARGPGWGRKPR